jgi:Type IV secretion-system coupling protein DNA-binding domain
MGWFGSQSKDEKETARLLADAKRLKAASRFQSRDDVRDWIIDLLVEVCNESDLCLSALVAQPLGNIVWRLLEREAFLFDDDLDWQADTLKEGVKLREKLRGVVIVLAREDHYLGIWRHAMKALLVGIVETLPANALTDPEPDGTVPDIPVLHPSTPMYELVDDLPLILTKIMGTLCAPDLQEAGLFQSFGMSVDRRLCLASGIPWMERLSSKRKVILPIERPDMPLGELNSIYTDETLFEGFFSLPVPIPIPSEIRFEHTHIVGGTGHGKTQLLQYLIMDDLHRALDSNLSLVVIDPDGTLIKTISQTDYFGGNLLADRAIFIDPTDVDHPVGLNLFDVSHLEGADSRTRETIENNTIELFEYFFDALLGSELTGKQTTLFRYLGLLLMQIPGGNIHTLRELMEDGRQFKSYMEKLEGSARTFFEQRFFAKDLQATKTQVLSRLWGVLSNRSLDRIFSAKRNSINFDAALKSGKIIFIHTSKEYLGEEGSHIFARLMVALLGQALIRRAAVEPDERNPAYIYIDEAEGVVDQTLVRLLAQARKYKGAITIAHQHLDQLSAGARAGILANTSIKLAGGVSAKDASALASEFRCKSDFILDQKKNDKVSHFALFAKNITPQGMTFEVPLGYAENCDRLSEEDYANLLTQSREEYGQSDVDLVPPITAESELSPVQTESYVTAPAPQADPVTPMSAESAPVPTYRKEGGGGARHSEIERMVKELGEAAGFRASLEETILDGAGRVDVILRRGDLTICCEVSVTTTREHELLNVRKCLEFGADQVWLVASSERHRTGLAKFIRAGLTDAEYDKITFLIVDELAVKVGQFAPKEKPLEKVVKGYRVRSSTPGVGAGAASRVHLSSILKADIG